MTNENAIGVLPSYIDNSMISTFRACPQKFFQQYIMKRALKSKSPDLHAGGASAHALEYVRKAFYLEGLSQEEALEKGFLAFMQFWGDYEPPLKKGKEHPKSFINTFSAIESYLQKWPLAEDVVKPYPHVENPFEFSFALPLPVQHPATSEPLLYAGRFDMLGEYTSLPFVVDEKTGGSIGDEWSRQWNMRGQFMGYTWATRQTGINAVGAIIRGSSIQKTVNNHAEVIITYDDWELERWYKQLIKTVERIVKMYLVWLHSEDDEVWDYDYGDACQAYWGCSMQLICGSRDREAWVGEYETSIWNPLDKDPTETRKQKTEEAEKFGLDELMEGM